MIAFLRLNQKVTSTHVKIASRFFQFFSEFCSNLKYFSVFFQKFQLLGLKISGLLASLDVNLTQKTNNNLRLKKNL